MDSAEAVFLFRHNHRHQSNMILLFIILILPNCFQHVSTVSIRETIFDIIENTEQACILANDKLFEYEVRSVVDCVRHCLRISSCSEVVIATSRGGICTGITKSSSSCVGPAFIIRGNVTHYKRRKGSCLNDACSNCVSCGDILQRYPYCDDGSYIVYPDSVTSREVWCDMNTDGGGWTVFQKRIDGMQNFDQNWETYKNGFGSVWSEHWLGNDVLHRMTQSGCELMIDMLSMSGVSGYAKYSNFSVGDESTGYKLSVDGFTGNASWDALGRHDSMAFSTISSDRDVSTRDCAALYSGGWWYKDCFNCKLNSLFNDSSITGMRWGKFPGGSSVLKSTMSVRCST